MTQSIHMSGPRKKNKSLFIIGLLTTACMSSAALADTTNDQLLKQMQSMQQQIEKLQAELDTVKKKAAAADKTAQTASNEAAATKAAAQLQPAAGVSSSKQARADTGSGITLMNKNNIKLTMGGFVEAAAISRTRNETADIGSNFSTGIPFPNSPSYHMSEFRGSARQSRLSLLAQGDVDPDTRLSAYYETDFLGAAPTANSNESNSYNLRMRQLFASVDREDLGMHVLGGQAWSLVTMNKTGIQPRDERIPMTIDAQYVPGFNWTRNPQARFVEDFMDKKLWFGISAESPQALIFSGPNTPSGSPTFNNPGGSLLSTATYSTDVAPDVIAKLAYDPGYGHYEAFGIARFFRDRNHFDNSTIMGGGGGASAFLPIIDKKLEFQISGMAGTGIGRYGSAQLPDITIKPDGGIATVDEVTALAGVLGHPTDSWDLYLYAGAEHALKKDFSSAGNGFGYGSPLYNNSGCTTEGAAASTCVANTSTVAQITAGSWWKFYKGGYGTAQLGWQESYTRRNIFSGVGGSPSTDDVISMISFRYYPF